jgi:hypothetical protein
MRRHTKSEETAVAMTRELSDDEIGFFKDNGYLLLSGMLDDTLCAAARDRMWASMPDRSRMKRDQPASHVGPFSAEDEDDNTMHLRKDYRWQIRDVGTEPLLIDLVWNDRLRGVAETLLGEGMLQPPVVGGRPMGSEGAAWPGGPVDPAVNEGIRGIYCTLPHGDAPRQSIGGHTDGHPFNLGIVGLIDEVLPEGGGFRIWPGSHKRLYPTFQMQYDQPRIPYYAHLPSYKGIIHSPAYLAELADIMADTKPVDCWGQTGDVVLWHHRLVHAAPPNYTQQMRQAVLNDFSRTDLDRCRLDPPQANMWRDWSDRTQQVSVAYSEAFAVAQRLPTATGESAGMQDQRG